MCSPVLCLKTMQTSSKKHFMKNVKECRDVIVKKASEQGRDAIGTQHTPFGPHSALTIIGRCYGSKVCVLCSDSIPTLF